jgi:hypothetical protein
MTEQASVATAPGQLWFDQGCDAFKRSFPEIAAKILADRFYVCPVCLNAFSEHALIQKILTREHVPPRSLGGMRLALTCKGCNSGAGHNADSHARREADLIGFAVGDLKEMKAHLRTESGRMPVRLSAAGDGVAMFGVKKASSELARDAVQRDFHGASDESKWEGFTFKVEFPSFSPDRAAASWLRSGYLAFFAALGYRFIYRPELDVVRARIMSPEPGSFRVIRPEKAEPALIRVEEPEAFRSYAMFFEHHAVFLPRYNDRGFYARLAEQPAGMFTFTGREYFWPSRGPTFFHDRALQ